MPPRPAAHEWFPPGTAAQVDKSVDEVRTEADPAPAAAPLDVPPKSDALNAETLKGTRWVDGPVDVEFMADGRWKMNGRICAQWAVEGNRVKIFDDKGEVHYVEIAGNLLEFNGKTIVRGER
jgi:hypothetical protein